VAQAQSAVAQAEARLKQLRATDLPVSEQSLRQARATLLNAQQQFERTSKLFRDGFVGKSQLDDAQRALDVAEAQVKSSEIQVASNRPGGSNAAIAETALAQALANLRTTQARLGYATITAPTDGTLIARDVERGNVVQPGKVLMTLSPAGETQLVVDIDEKNLAYLSLGQKALGSADAYPNQTFPAELVYINPGVDPLRGSIEVKLRVPSPPAYLLQDMTVSVDIEVARHHDVLTIPADGVHDVAGPNPWSLVVRGNTVRRQPVKVAARGEGRIEIGEGLKAGDLVVPATNVDVAEGRRVRPTVDDARARRT
jgi:HlyD family secretion protein